MHSRLNTRLQTMLFSSFLPCIICDNAHYISSALLLVHPNWTKTGNNKTGQASIFKLVYCDIALHVKAKCFGTECACVLWFTPQPSHRHFHSIHQFQLFTYPHQPVCIWLAARKNINTFPRKIESRWVTNELMHSIRQSRANERAFKLTVISCITHVCLHFGNIWKCNP